MSDDNPFSTLADCEWLDSPGVTLHEWRVRLPAHRGATHLQVEFMRMATGQASMIVSAVRAVGRGTEVVVGKRALRTLRELLNASDLSDDPQHRERSEAPGPMDVLQEALAAAARRSPASE